MRGLAVHSVVTLPLRPAADGAAMPIVGPRALLIVHEPGARAAAPRSLLKARYGLTKAEIDIVLQIAAGARIGDAAGLAPRFGLDHSEAP